MEAIKDNEKLFVRIRLSNGDMLVTPISRIGGIARNERKRTIILWDTMSSGNRDLMTLAKYGRELGARVSAGEQVGKFTHFLNQLLRHGPDSSGEAPTFSFIDT